MFTPSRRLLILSCSQRKRFSPELLPALERYDGPAFRVLRKFLRESPLEAQDLDILVLSAEFGLVSACRAIPYYDRRMTLQRANELRPHVLATLEGLLGSATYQDVFISMPKDYLQALTGYERTIAGEPDITVAAGTQGRKLTELRDWLSGGRPALLPSRPGSARRGKARIRGIEIALTARQVLDVARTALAAGCGEPNTYQSWYLEVDGRRVGVKWLVSVLTGLPVSAFVTDEARRVLEQLAIPLRRV